MIVLRRLWFRITGRCEKFIPGPDGICVVCRIPGAGVNKP